MSLDLKEIKPEYLPSTPLSVLKALPVSGGIYFVISESEEILYIGRSRNLQRRLRGHHRLAQFKKASDVRIAWLGISDDSLLPDIEAALILYFSPTHNGTLVHKGDNTLYTNFDEEKLKSFSVVRNSISIEENANDELTKLFDTPTPKGSGILKTKSLVLKA